MWLIALQLLHCLFAVFSGVFLSSIVHWVDVSELSTHYLVLMTDKKLVKLMFSICVSCIC